MTSCTLCAIFTTALPHSFHIHLPPFYIVHSKSIYVQTMLCESLGLDCFHRKTHLHTRPLHSAAFPIATPRHILTLRPLQNRTNNDKLAPTRFATSHVHTPVHYLVTATGCTESTAVSLTHLQRVIHTLTHTHILSVHNPSIASTAAALTAKEPLSPRPIILISKFPRIRSFTNLFSPRPPLPVCPLTNCQILSYIYIIHK